jgi:hypothetical protein
VDWGIHLHSNLSLHRHSSSARSALDSEQLASSEHSDLQQQGSRNCWGVESHNVVEW